MRPARILILAGPYAFTACTARQWRERDPRYRGEGRAWQVAFAVRARDPRAAIAYAHRWLAAGCRPPLPARRTPLLAAHSSA